MNSNRNETPDRYAAAPPKSADGWAQQLAADRNNYQQGTHQQKYSQDLHSAQSFVNQHFGQLQITGFQGGHLVGLDRKSHKYMSLVNGKETALGGTPRDFQTLTGHLARFNADGSGQYQVGQQDRSGMDLARSILKDRGMPGPNNDADPSDTQVANFQRDILRANGRKINDLNWFKHLKPGQILNVPAGEQSLVLGPVGPIGNRPTAPVDAPYSPPPDAPYAPYSPPPDAPYSPYSPPPDAPYSPYSPPPDAPYSPYSPPPIEEQTTPPWTQMLSPQPETAATKEQETQATVDRQNGDLDAGFKFASQLYGNTGNITDTQISAALNHNPNDEQRQGLLALQDNLAKSGSSTINRDDVESIKNQQEAATWMQAAKDSPALLDEMIKARNAMTNNHQWFGFKQYLMDDKIDQLLAGSLSEDDREGLGFLKRHYSDMVRGDEGEGLLWRELDSWTKVD